MLTLRKKPAVGYLAAVLSVAGVTAVSWSARSYFKGEYASLLYVLAFLLVDLLYMFIDPRIRA